MPRLFVDKLTVIDCSILDPQRGLIGASWTVDIELAGELDEQSMVFDFAKVKRRVKQWIDQEVDHKLLVPTADERIDIQRANKQTDIHFVCENGDSIDHHSPESSLCIIDAKRASRDVVETYIKERLFDVLPNNVSDVVVALHEEASPGSFYTYSHGLKKHDGNCQRIAHGHRSRIQIWKNGRRNGRLEKEFSKRWSDIYIGTCEDVIKMESNSIKFAYTTEQGNFRLTLPVERVHLMESDSTIECIAEHILDLLEKDMPQHTFKVRAFEGIGKGAIAAS